MINKNYFNSAITNLKLAPYLSKSGMIFTFVFLHDIWAIYYGIYFSIVPSNLYLVVVYRYRS